MRSGATPIAFPFSRSGTTRSTILILPEKKSMVLQVPDPSIDTGKAGVEPQDFSYQNHRRLIGYLGLLLPPLLYLLAGIRPTSGLPQWELLDSISAYYYTGGVAVFVGVLFALSLFLFTYPGYEGAAADRIVGALGGAAALGVALFPTAAPAGLAEPSWWSPATRVIHYTSATLLFGSFIIFSLWLFRKSKIPIHRDRPRNKRRRDAIYLGCGLVMIGCMLWAGGSYFTGATIFWPESIALWAFAISWLVKGQAHVPLVEKAQALWK